MNEIYLHTLVSLFLFTAGHTIISAAVNFVYAGLQFRGALCSLRHLIPISGLSNICTIVSFMCELDSGTTWRKTTINSHDVAC